MLQASECLRRALRGVPGTSKDAVQVVNVGRVIINASMYALALEMALKGALQLEGKEFANRHNLKEHFERLSPQLQKAISAEWETMLHTNSSMHKPFSQFVGEHANDHTIWRFLDWPEQMQRQPEITPDEMDTAISAVRAGIERLSQ